MITQSNIISATNAVNKHSLTGLEDTIKALRTALNIITPDANIEYTFSKLGGSVDTNETIEVALTIQYDHTPDNLTIHFMLRYRDSTPLILFHHDGVEVYAGSTQQIVDIAKFIHKTFIHKHNTFDQSITIDGLTAYQKQIVTDFIRKHNLTNI